MGKYTYKIKGRIAGCTTVEQFHKNNGEESCKVVFHIVADDGQEVAVTATGDLTRYAGEINARVCVEYVCRVFSFDKKGRSLFGNDVYAIRITRI